jgi:PAS domain S-box-containing protein
MLKQRTSKGYSKALVTAIKKNGRLLPCEITSAIFIAAGIENAITTIADISESILAQKNIDTRKEKIVAGNIVLAMSKQKKIDVKKEKKVSDNIVRAKSRQKKIDEKKEKKVSDNIILARSKQKKIDVKKEKRVSDNISLARSKQRKIDKKTKKKVSDNILLAQAKSGKERQFQEIATTKLLKEYRESFTILFNSSPDVLFDRDLITNVVMVSEAFEREFGYKITARTTSDKEWMSHIHPDDREAVFGDYSRMLRSSETEWKYSYRFLRADDSVASVSNTSIIFRDSEGKAYRIIGSMHDNSKEKVLEEKLEHEIRLKEKQITEAAEDAKDAERSDIGKELHDNINQLLGASRLFLEMAKRGGDKSKMYLSRSSQYTLSAIEEIRKLTKGLTTDTIKNLGLCEAIENISRDTMEVNPVKISYNLGSFIEHSVNDKFKLNIFRIIQEQLNNILKHARATKARITLLQNKRAIILSIADNGIGFDTGKKRMGIGIDNIKSRAGAYNGNADFISQPGQSCILTVTFPFTEAARRS